MTVETAAIVQARMGSSRLPGKVLADLGGIPVLEWVVRRAEKSAVVDAVVIATTVGDEDTAVADLGRSLGCEIVRGPVEDVLARYVQATKTVEAETLVRVTGDCPLIGPDVIDLVVNCLRSDDLDYCTTRLPPPHPRSYPLGQDAEAITASCLFYVDRVASAPYEREHVTPFIYKRGVEFRWRLVQTRQSYPDVRLTVDYPEDLALLRRIVTEFEITPETPWESVARRLSQRPDLTEINAGLHQKRLDE